MKLVKGGVTNKMIAKNIKDYIDSKGISQTYISNKTGIPLPKLNGKLNGKVRITAEEFFIICEALEADPIEISEFHQK